MPIILDPIAGAPTPALATFPTLGQYRRRLADAAGFTIQTATTALAGAANQLVVADFISSELESTFLGNTWAYQPLGPNAGQNRRVVYGGLAPGTGTVTVEAPYSVATPAGTPVEFHGKLPATRREGRLGLNDIVNRVLAECWTVQKLPIPAVQDQRVYPMGAYPWLRAEDQVIEVYSLGQTTDPNAQDQLMINWRWVPAGDNPGIEVAMPLNAGDTLKVQCFVPLSWWINQGAGFGLVASEGLVSETDQALLNLMGMEIIGASYVYWELAKWGLPEDRAEYRQLRAQARAAANEWKRLSLDHPKIRKQHWPAMLTVRSRDNYGYHSYMTPG